MNASSFKAPGAGSSRNDPAGHGPESFREEMLPGAREPIEEARTEDEKEDMYDEVAEVIGTQGLKQQTSIVYSDKSESSIESMMEDTPSNYNILNGRLDEASRGLRSAAATVTKANRIIAAFKNTHSPRRTRGILDTIKETEMDN